MRKLKYHIEYWVLLAFLWVIRSLPLHTASDFGAWLGRSIGMRMARTKLARAQIAQHLPEMDEATREATLLAMWDHLGRVVAEYPHLTAGHLDAHLTIEGSEYVQDVIKSGKTALFISGHIGHWELTPKTIALCGLPLHLVYRPPNNPLADRIIDTIRSHYTLGHYGKGADGAKGMIAAIRRGESVGMLIDQKDNTGALIPFLGAPAMTMLSAARLALKYNMVVIPVRARRLKGPQFKVTIGPPMQEPPAALPEEERYIAFMRSMNNQVSQWIRETPEQWFWLHRRWPKT